ncbi:sugar porter family MFS transporter [Alteromonas sp. KUL106]|uniref:sugar porter family MFS transporter n=1 Tax=Alteromonas sp. KUL106 TaxID=2480799 RepID=UPI0012E58795|nr:sugar porter family MFS transporter [Alteromonas sp. KUL106]GFD69300.1 MFS transporter [Alteromonas sp. KUL106]
MKKALSPSLYYTLIVSLGGFIFGFDASVIAGANGFIDAEFGLNDWQQGFVVSSPTLGALIAMLFAGGISDAIGRRKALILVAFLYLLSSVGSALAPNFAFLVLSRFIGGIAFCSLIIAPLYISEISAPQNRGKMVSVNQLNIVFGFALSYFTNYYLLQLSNSGTPWVTDIGLNTHLWRYMLGLEIIPALLWFSLLFTIPRSPRWLVLKGRQEEAEQVINRLFDHAQAKALVEDISSSLKEKSWSLGERLGFLKTKAMRFPLMVGIIIAIAQQITGINVIFFYAPTIFEQSGVGTNAAFMQAVLIGVVNVAFTIAAMLTIDKWGRKPLLLIGLTGVVISMAICTYGFKQATYQIQQTAVVTLSQESPSVAAKLTPLIEETYFSDVDFKRALKTTLTSNEYDTYQQSLLTSSITMNAPLVLFGIIAFVASFAMSLGPVMWAMLAEIFPNQTRALAISLVGMVNSLTSFLVQMVFPWELANLGAAATFAIYGGFALVSLILVAKLFPETKGRSLEDITKDFEQYATK